MRKFIVILGVAIISLSSCGGGDSGLKSLIEKGVKLDCRKDELREKENAGDMAAAHERDDIKKELKELRQEFFTKYKDKMEDKDFEKKVKQYEDEFKMKYCVNNKK